MNQTAHSPVWFVTGCSTGFGRHIAEYVLAQGYRVVVTARKPEQLKDLQNKGEALVLPLDVTDPRQAKIAIESAEAAFGAVDVLVNNAGVGYFASVEESDLNQVRQMMDVNFYGVANMLQAALSGMRQRRQGIIVNLTSIGGLCGLPAVGYYCASKFAVEGLSETLRQEVAPLGIHVMTVEPSAFRTEWAGSAHETPHTHEDYAPTAGAAIEAYHQSIGRQPGDPARAAAAIFKAVEGQEKPARLLLGNSAFECALGKLDELARDFGDWEAVSRGADYPG